MDTEIRRQQVEFHHQQLRDQADAERIARRCQDRLGSPYPTARIPRTIGVRRRLVGTAAG